MLNMILKDLRISPLRNILTGISMFVGIIAMISSVLVGTLGKEYLISVNAQMYGWSPTYSFSITGSDFQDTIKMENFFREIYNTDHFVAVTFSMLEEITVAPVASVSSLQDISDTVYKKTVPVDVVFTTSTYNKIYNLPMSSGDWFDSSEINKTLCMVVNKAAQNYFDTSYAVGNVESSLSLTPFNVVGTVNDGTDIPTVYLDAHSIELLVPNMWKVKNATVHWHSEAGITMRQMYSSLHDILEDTIGGNLDIIGKSDIGDTYNSVLSVLQLGLLVTSFLLLFVSVNSNDDPLPCKGMAALGGSRHALINLSTQIDIPPIIKKSLSPATGYFGHKDEQSHHLNTFYVSFASVCALQMGAFCILQNFFQRNFCFRPAFEKVVCIITRKGEVLPPFDRKEVRTWNLIAENFKSNVPFKVSVNGCCTTKRATPTTKSGDAGNGKYRFATLPCMRNGSFTPLTSIFKTKKLNRVIKWQEKR